MGSERRQLRPIQAGETPARVLEVGCGDGWLCRELAQAGYDIVGIDPQAPDDRLLQAVTLDDFDSELSFDAVVAVLSLHHARRA